jgi:hypothetical protein
VPERRKPRWLHFSGPKRPIFRSKADIFRSNSAEIAHRCCVGLEIPAERDTRHQTSRLAPSAEDLHAIRVVIAGGGICWRLPFGRPQRMALC